MERDLTRLLSVPSEDQPLLAELEALAVEPAFGLLAHRYGPALYAKNPAHFRPFILSHLSLSGWDGRRYRQLEWKKVEAQFAPWLLEVDRKNDIPLFRALYGLQLRSLGAQAEKEWRQALATRLRTASTPAERSVELQKLRLGYRLDEETALAIYELEPEATRDFILDHLPYLFSWTGSEKRRPWQRLWDATKTRDDEKLYLRLYRRQVSVASWRTEVLALAASVRDPAKLDTALEQRHPQGLRLELGDTIVELLRARGRDVFPYVFRHLQSIYNYGWGERKAYAALRALAVEQGWTELWGALVRTCAQPKEFEAELESVLMDRSLSDAETVRKLSILSGVSRELNFTGLGIALVRPLSDAHAVRIYESYPNLLRGPFRANVAPSWHSTYPRLMQLAIEAKDEPLVDYLASRIAARSHGIDEKVRRQIDELAEYYSVLLADDVAFSRRAASVLGIVPAYSIFAYGTLIKENKLARLFYERSASRYLEDPDALRDLLEASEIHAQALGFRALGLDDARARRAAIHNLDLLLASLLRPLHRRTRALTFRALDNATGELDPARAVLDRAREAMDLPDRKYPKDALVALIGRILHRWPELRGPEEITPIYRKGAA